MLTYFISIHFMNLFKFYFLYLMFYHILNHIFFNVEAFFLLEIILLCNCFSQKLFFSCLKYTVKDSVLQFIIIVFSPVGLHLLLLLIFLIINCLLSIFLFRSSKLLKNMRIDIANLKLQKETFEKNDARLIRECSDNRNILASRRTTLNNAEALVYNADLKFKSMNVRSKSVYKC